MNTSQRGLWTMSKGEFEQSIRSIESAIASLGGNPCQIFDRVRTDRVFANRIADFMLRDWQLEASIYHERARAIMGKNFFGVEEWLTLYGVKFSNKQLREVADFPWDENILNSPCPFMKGKSIKETHFAFLGIDSIKNKPLTINRWQELHPKYFYTPEIWHEKEKFAGESTCGFRWYLMLLESVPDLIAKTHAEQIAILPVEYGVAFVIEETTKLILYHRKNGDYLNTERPDRCQDVSDGYHIGVGYRNTGELLLTHIKDTCQYSYIGLALYRKRKP